MFTIMYRTLMFMLSSIRPSYRVGLKIKTLNSFISIPIFTFMICIGG